MSYIGNTSTTQSFVPAIDYFSGNGSTTAFTLSRPVASVAQVQAVIENVAQNPSTAFTVSGNTITFTSAPPTGSNNIYIYYTSPVTQLIAPSQGTVYPSSLSTGGMYWDTSSNVGIGTTSPSTKLEIIGNYKQKYAVGNSQGFTISLNSSDDVILSNYYNAAMRFETNNTERMRIDTSGTLQIGTSSGLGGKLDVYQTADLKVGAFRSTNTGQTNPLIEVLADRNTTNNSYYAIKTGVAGVGYRFQVADSGNVANTNNSYGAISDIKLKENIVDATPKLDDLCKVQIRQFNLKSEPNHKQLGVIAQELEEIFPAMVEESPDKDMEGNDLGTTTKTVKYSVFVPMLIKAIQEQQAIINELKSRIEVLENK